MERVETKLIKLKGAKHKLKESTKTTVLKLKIYLEKQLKTSIETLAKRGSIKMAAKSIKTPAKRGSSNMAAKAKYIYLKNHS